MLRGQGRMGVANRERGPRKCRKCLAADDMGHVALGVGLSLYWQK